MLCFRVNTCIVIIPGLYSIEKISEAVSVGDGRSCPAIGHFEAVGVPRDEIFSGQAVVDETYMMPQKGGLIGGRLTVSTVKNDSVEMMRYVVGKISSIDNLV